MKFSVEQSDLKKNLSFLQKTFPTKPSLPILTSVHLQLSGSTLTLAATDLFFGVKTSVQVESESEDGVCVIPGRQFIEIINSYSPQKMKFVYEAETLVITAGKSKTKLQAYDSSEYPDFPSISGKEFTLPFSSLEEIHASVGYSASLDQARPVLNALLFSFLSDGLEVVATDGFRLSTLNFEINEEFFTKSLQLIIPQRSYYEIVRIGKQAKSDEVKFSYSAELQQLFCSFNDVEIYVRLIEGNYPPYQKIIPSEFAYEVVLSGDEVLSSLKKAAIFSRDASDIVTISFGQEQVSILSMSPSLGMYENNILPEKNSVTSDLIEISFNGKYLIDFFSQIKPEKVWFGFNDALKPVMLKSNTHTSLKYIVMPFKKTQT